MKYRVYLESRIIAEFLYELDARRFVELYDGYNLMIYRAHGLP